MYVVMKNLFIVPHHFPLFYLQVNNKDRVWRIACQDCILKCLDMSNGAIYSIRCIIGVLPQDVHIEKATLEEHSKPIYIPFHEQSPTEKS